MTEPVENLYYALGQLAYAIAKADGNIQDEEKMTLHTMLIQEARAHGIDLDISNIIFELMQRDNTDSEKSYTWAMNELKRNSNYFIPVMCDKFIKILEKVARAYPPVVEEEKTLLERFKREVKTL
jgi:uncharacterized tellurite resistance protein B-like protein